MVAGRPLSYSSAMAIISPAPDGPARRPIVMNRVRVRTRRLLKRAIAARESSNRTILRGQTWKKVGL